MNKVWLIGNLTRDPELTETPNGVSVCRFDIAVNRNYTNGDGERQTDFFHITAWRGLAESVARYCAKGSKVAVTGSVQMRTYEDNSGQKRTAVDVIAQDVEFLSKPAQQREDGDPYDQTPQKKSKPKQQRMEVFDDDGDIPF